MVKNSNFILRKVFYKYKCIVCDDCDDNHCYSITIFLDLFNTKNRYSHHRVILRGYLCI